MHTTLMKFLMISAIAPMTALAQDPPLPPLPPLPPAPVRIARPALPAMPVLPEVHVSVPSINFDFNYDFKYIEPDVRIAMEDARRAMQQRSREDNLDFQRVEREAQRAQQEAQREMDRAQVDVQREVQRAQAEAQREMQRAQVDMQRSFGTSFSNTFSYSFGTGVGEDRFNSAKPRKGWAKEDPADSLYRSARETLNRGEYRRAAQQFNDLAKKFPKSQYALDSQYWEAFARYRSGTTDDLKQALKILDEGKVQFASMRTSGYDMDVPGLRARIQGTLAARGDANAAKALQADAAQSNGGCDREEISVRSEALSALGRMDLASAMPVVKKVLARRDDCTVELRRGALYLLGRQPNSESVPLMLDVAKNDPDQNIRREAMGWLSRTAGDQAVPMLEDLLKSSNDEQTQRSAVQALGSIDTDKARKAIHAIIERTDALERVRAEAIGTLARDRDNRAMGADDMAYLRSLYSKVETPRLKEAVLSAVSRIEAPENEAWLLGIAKNENESSSLRAQALQRLGRMTTISFSEIGKLYENADSRELRQQILGALSQRKEPEAVDKLVEVAKKDTDPNIRRYAIQLLARSNNPKAIQGIKDLADKP